MNMHGGMHDFDDMMGPYGELAAHLRDVDWSSRTVWMVIGGMGMGTVVVGWIVVHYMNKWFEEERLLEEAAARDMHDGRTSVEGGRAVADEDDDDELDATDVTDVSVEQATRHDVHEVAGMFGCPLGKVVESVEDECNVGRFLNENKALAARSVRSESLKNKTRLLENGPNMSPDERKEEAQIRAQQMAKIYEMMKEQGKYGVNAPEDMRDQMKLYNFS